MFYSRCLLVLARWTPVLCSLRQCIYFHFCSVKFGNWKLAAEMWNGVYFSVSRVEVKEWSVTVARLIKIVTGAPRAFSIGPDIVYFAMQSHFMLNMTTFMQRWPTKWLVIYWHFLIQTERGTQCNHCLGLVRTSHTKINTLRDHGITTVGISIIHS